MFLSLLLLLKESSFNSFRDTTCVINEVSSAIAYSQPPVGLVEESEHVPTPLALSAHPKNDDGLHMPRLGGKRRIHTEQGLRRYLIREEGFVFVPKNRVVVVPGEEFHEHGIYQKYLRRHVYFDPFGEDHKQRKSWQNSISKNIDVDLVTGMCVGKNQFTGNSIAAVLAYTEILASRKYAHIAPLAKALSSIQSHLFDVYTGPKISDEVLSPYILKAQKSNLPSVRSERNKHRVALRDYAMDRYRNLSYEDKLTIVHKFCDGVVDALWQIAKHTNPNPKPIKIHVTGRPRKEASVDARVTADRNTDMKYL